MDSVIRPATPDDVAAVVELAVAAELFAPEEAGIVEGLMSEYFERKQAEGDLCVLDVEAEPLGVAYYAPATAADRAWYLTMIAVKPERQGHGRGGSLLRHVEDDLRTRGNRLLLVETSGAPQYDRTRDFYRKCGYTEEARIRDFWTQGDDNVIFRKALN